MNDDKDTSMRISTFYKVKVKGTEYSVIHGEYRYSAKKDKFVSYLYCVKDLKDYGSAFDEIIHNPEEENLSKIKLSRVFLCEYDVSPDIYDLSGTKCGKLQMPKSMLWDNGEYREDKTLWYRK